MPEEKHNNMEMPRDKDGKTGGAQHAPDKRKKHSDSIPAAEGNPTDSETGSDVEKPEDKMETVTVEAGEYEELKAMAGERDNYLERLRRAIAENMNLQNRIEKIRRHAATEAMRELARKVVPIADSLARARENAEQTAGAESICEGLKLVEQEFYDILKELKVEPVHALGRHFDPDYHDAVYQQETEETEPNVVVGELKKGFLIDGMLLRPAQVVVAASPQTGESAMEQNETSGEEGIETG